MSIEGLENRSVGEVQAEVAQGARFVMFPYCVSLLVVTLRRSSAVTYLPPGESALGKGLPYILLSLFLGWWGFPFGLIFTPICIIQNLAGGKDVTAEIMGALAADAGPPPGTYDPRLAPPPSGPTDPPPSGWVGG